MARAMVVAPSPAGRAVVFCADFPRVAAAKGRTSTELLLACAPVALTMSAMTGNLFQPDAPEPVAQRPWPPPWRRGRCRWPTACVRRSLDEVVGQQELLGPGGPLRLLLETDRLPSLLLWGPPGCGKTTAGPPGRPAHAAPASWSTARSRSARKELKAVMAEARQAASRSPARRTILFLDEIHRFNKAQQDALLPWVERGDVTLIGATTENPSFEVNSALISRTRLFVLQAAGPGGGAATCCAAALADAARPGRRPATWTTRHWPPWPPSARATPAPPWACWRPWPRPRRPAPRPRPATDPSAWTGAAGA